MGRFRLEPFPTIREKSVSGSGGESSQTSVCVVERGGGGGGRVVVWLGDLKKVTFFF